MKTIQIKTLFIALLLSTAAPSLPAEAGWEQRALWKGAELGNLSVVKRALEAGANVNERDMFGLTALMYAALFGHLEIAELLLERGAIIDMEIEEEVGGRRNGDAWRVKSGETALKIAKHRGHTGIVKLINDFIIERRRKVAEMILETREEEGQIVPTELGKLISEFEIRLEK